MTFQPIPSTGPPEPLTAAEEAEVRAQHARSMSALVQPSSARYDVGRLLATLDAARREARAGALAAVEEAVRGLRSLIGGPLDPSHPQAKADTLDAVLAVLAKLQEDEQ